MVQLVYNISKSVTFSLEVLIVPVGVAALQCHTVWWEEAITVARIS